MPLDSVKQIDTDVLLTYTTGAKLDLSPLLQLTLRSRLLVGCLFPGNAEVWFWVLHQQG
jgi:hypothetical protein